jgi:hypothetical protein
MFTAFVFGPLIRVGEHRSDSQAEHTENTNDEEGHSKRKDEPIPYIGQPIPRNTRPRRKQMAQRRTKLCGASKSVCP